MTSTPSMDHPILISVGTRPEIIKMAPVHRELRRFLTEREVERGERAFDG